MDASERVGQEKPLVARRDDGGVVTLTLNQGDRFNPLSQAMIAALDEHLRAVAADRAARVVILAAAGRGFCAGHDLRELRAHREDPAWQRGLFGDCTRMMIRLTELPQPVIARVHGVATAAGCQLVAACDLAVAADTARFATPGVKIGLFCSTPMVPLSRAVGRKRALEMLLTGELIDAQRARDWGLVNVVVPEDELEDAVAALAETIVRSSPLTVAIGKEAFYAQVELDEHRAYDLTKSVMAMNSLAGDAQEGMCAFLEKRPPEWKGE